MIPPLAGATSTDVAPQTTTSRDSTFADALAGALAVGDVLAAAAAVAPPLPPLAAEAPTDPALAGIEAASDAAPDLATIGTDGPDVVPVGVEMPALERGDAPSESLAPTRDQVTPGADRRDDTPATAAVSPAPDAPAPAGASDGDAAITPPRPTRTAASATDLEAVPATAPASVRTGEDRATPQPATQTDATAPPLDGPAAGAPPAPGRETVAPEARPVPVDDQPRVESRPAAANPAAPSTAPATTSGATGPTPGSSAAAAATDTVRYLRELGPARAVQRLAVDLDGATVALRIDRAGPTPSIHVHVVDDPAGRLDPSWTAGVERTLAQAFGHDHPGGGRRDDQRRPPADHDDLPPPPASRRWAEALTGVRP